LNGIRLARDCTSARALIESAGTEMASRIENIRTRGLGVRNRDGITVSSLSGAPPSIDADHVTGTNG
jgi:hypothetical protein